MKYNVCMQNLPRQFKTLLNTGKQSLFKPTLFKASHILYLGIKIKIKQPMVRTFVQTMMLPCLKDD